MSIAATNLPPSNCRTYTWPSSFWLIKISSPSLPIIGRPESSARFIQFTTVEGVSDDP